MSRQVEDILSAPVASSLHSMQEICSQLKLSLDMHIVKYRLPTFPHVPCQHYHLIFVLRKTHLYVALCSNQVFHHFKIFNTSANMEFLEYRKRYCPATCDDMHIEKVQQRMSADIVQYFQYCDQDISLCTGGKCDNMHIVKTLDGKRI